MYKNLAFLIVIITNCYCGFQEVDKLGLFTVDEDVRHFPIYNVPNNDIIAFDDHLFGTVYLRNTDKFAYSTFMKNGEAVTTPKQISNKGATHGISACKYNANQMFTLPQMNFNGFYTTVYGQMIDTNGDKVDGLIEIEKDFKATFAHCIQFNTNLIGIFYAAWAKETGMQENWDIYSLTYNPVTKALSSPTVVNTVDTRGWQAYSSVTKINSNKFIVVFEGQDYNVGAGMRHIFIQEFNNLGQKVNNNIKLQDTLDSVHTTPEIASDSDGSFSIVWNLNSTRKIMYVSYGPGELATSYRCGIEVDSNSKFSNVAVHNGIAYVKYRNEDEKAYAVEIKTLDCSIHKAKYLQDEPYTQTNVQGRMIISDNAEATYLVMNRQFETSGAEEHLKIFMYLIEQKSICSIRRGCVGCDINFGGSNTCPICIGSTEAEKLNRVSPDGQCTCKEGEYDNGSNIDCQTCNSTICKGCENTATTCTSCNDNYYLDGTTCTQCPLPYAKCTDENTPTECKVGVQRGDLAALCVCNSGWIEQAGSVDCLQCTPPCKTCSTNQNNCESCVDNYYKTGNTCTQCPLPYAKCSDENTPTECKIGIQRGDLSQSCICNPGWVEQSGSVDCLQCTAPCKTCSTNQTTCESCEDGYYFSGNSCIQCPLPFSKCTGESYPTECKVGTGRLDNTQNCQCDSGYVEKSGQVDCIECVSPCQTCTVDENTCESCDDGFYLVGNSCVSCPIHFSKCTAEDVPTECKSGIGRSLEISENCGCQSGYFEISNQLNCEKCSFPCESCSISSQNCSTCLVEEGIGRNNSPNCLCKEGYFLMNLKCQKCDNKFCATCSLAADNCVLKCGDLCDTCDSEGNCLTCKDGLFMNGGVCEDCGQETCKKCTPEKLCAECQNPDLLPPLCQEKNKGQLVKLTENSMGISEIIFETCNSKCTNCENTVEQCTSCSHGSNRNLQLPCNCLDGFHDNNGTTKNCEKCPISCKTCSSSDRCIECISQDLMIIGKFTQICECISGYRFNIQEKICQKCFKFMGECVLECPPNYQPDLSSFSCTQVEYNELKYIKVYWICGISIIVLSLISILSFVLGKQTKKIKDQKYAKGLPKLQK